MTRQGRKGVHYLQNERKARQRDERELEEDGGVSEQLEQPWALCVRVHESTGRAGCLLTSDRRAPQPILGPCTMDGGHALATPRPVSSAYSASEGNKQLDEARGGAGIWSLHALRLLYRQKPALFLDGPRGQRPR